MSQSLYTLNPEAIICHEPELRELAERYGNILSIPVVKQVSHNTAVLELNVDGLCLKQLGQKQLGELRIDFADGALTWRRLHGGGAGQAIAKAIGVKQKKAMRILDATAGTATDSFVLASLGCHVTMIERHPVVALLLQDALDRAQLIADVYDVTKNMDLITGNAIEVMDGMPENSFDVVLLDPMFPHTGKTAQVKKSMQYFRDMVGKDEDADLLLEPASRLAKYRVVVKRPRKSPFLLNRKPTMSHEGKANRFDIYVKTSIKAED
ncbi:class I SAM-dependent methyltransferase [Bermanella sp. R86510]|uniref:class I SAM-dependent methyltransferase n=1 Tax=unclassified Bermanella TaxID=2627862 RepID=UPI0037C96279